MTAILGVLAGAFPSWSATLQDESVAASTNGGGSVTATWTIKNDGTTSRGQTWLGTGSASDWEVRATLSSGDTPTGTLGTWLNCGTNRSWSISASGGTDSAGVSNSCTLLVELRSGGVVAASASIFIQATSRLINAG